MSGEDQALVDVQDLRYKLPGKGIFLEDVAGELVVHHLSQWPESLED